MMVTGMWNFTTDLWQHCNTMVHRKTVEEQVNLIMANLCSQVIVC
jgi:hypothetical protein